MKADRSEYTEESLDKCKGEECHNIVWIIFKCAISPEKAERNSQLIMQTFKSESRSWGIKWKVGTAAVSFLGLEFFLFYSDHLIGPWNGPLINTESSKLERPLTWHTDRFGYKFLILEMMTLCFCTTYFTCSLCIVFLVVAKQSDLPFYSCSP